MKQREDSLSFFLAYFIINGVLHDLLHLTVWFEVISCSFRNIIESEINKLANHRQRKREIKRGRERERE